MEEIKTNEEMLELIREDRPAQTIHEVTSFRKNDLGFYDVNVYMKGDFMGTIVNRIKFRLPYPISAYKSLPEGVKEMWREDNG